MKFVGKKMQITKKSVISSFGPSFLGLGLFQDSAMGFTLDLFNDVDSDPDQAVVDNTYNDGGKTLTNGSGAALSNVIGGVRTIEVEKLTNNSTFNDVRAFVSTETNIFSYSSSSGTQGSFSITWDGDFGAGIDLIDEAETDQNYFQIDVAQNDLGVTLEFEVSDEATPTPNTSTYQQSIPAGTLGSIYFPYASFSDPSVLESAQSITLRSVGAPAALDLDFSVVGTSQNVPFEFSPTVGIVLGGSFIGFKVLKKRRHWSRPMKTIYEASSRNRFRDFGFTIAATLIITNVSRHISHQMELVPNRSLLYA